MEESNTLEQARRIEEEQARRIIERERGKSFSFYITESEANSFARSIMPWLMRKMNVKACELDRPPPHFHVRTRWELQEFFESFNVGFACYCAPVNEACLQSHSESEDYTQSAIVHELVHYIQAERGILSKDANEPSDFDTILACEKEAYNIQACFLREVCLTSPAKYGLDEAGMQKCIRNSVQTCLDGE